MLAKKAPVATDIPISDATKDSPKVTPGTATMSKSDRFVLPL